MSFTELLEAARALPREEQLQLADAIQGPEPTIEERLLNLKPDAPRSGRHVDLLRPQFNEDALRAVQRAMSRIEGDRI